MQCGIFSNKEDKKRLLFRAIRMILTNVNLN